MPVHNLLNFNGIDGSAVFTDDGLTPASWNTLFGSPVLETDEFKFGSSSLYLDGLSAIQSNDFDVSDKSIDFTIEMFFKSINNPSNVQTLCYLSDTVVVGMLVWSNQLYYYDAPNGTWVTGVGDLVEDVWYHAALCRKDGQLYIGVDGEFKIVEMGFDIGSDLETLTIGARFDSLTQPLIGYVDSIRVSVGECLYNFRSTISDTPQVEPTTTILSTLPSLPTDMKSVPDVFKSSGVPPVYKQGTSVNGSGEEIITPEDPTSTNIVSGNVEKLGLPYGANVTVVSLGLNAKVLGTGVSDSVTGDYSIDVYPHTDEVLIYVAPDYGKVFVESGLVTVGEIVHPTVPNRYVYVCTVGGNLGNSEPVWSTEGLITSGGVTFNTLPLHRPLMNGFIKPVVTPI